MFGLVWHFNFTAAIREFVAVLNLIFENKCFWMNVCISSGQQIFGTIIGIKIQV